MPQGRGDSGHPNDPDRLRAPVKRTAQGWESISWEEALDTTIARLGDIRDKHGKDAIAAYTGNPSSHNQGLMLFSELLPKLIGTRNRFDAGSIDSWPMQLVCHLMYGHQFLVPVPDIDRTRHMVIVGANPLASNGSMMTAPDVQRRLKNLRERGKLVVIDPRRGETAKVADEHHFIRPGKDPWLLLAMIHILFRDDRIRLRHWQDRVDGLDEVRKIVADITPERAARHCEIEAREIERITRELCEAECAALYGRFGTCAQAFGSISQWAIQLFNLLTGNLDREGGTMIATPAMNLLHQPHVAGSHARFRTRISGLPECAGHLPSVALAEEIMTPGAGQIRALFCVAGNPASSVSGSAQLNRALGQLEFMVALDIYINETSRHAGIILPSCSPLERPHFDVFFHAVSVRNTVRYGEPVFEKPDGVLYDHEVINGLAARWAKRYGLEFHPMTPEAIIDGVLRANGEYPGMTLEEVRKHPHGIDLGALKPALAKRLEQEGRKLDAAPRALLDDVPKLLALPLPNRSELLLIGRRNVRSNNSWMNNFPRLTKGRRHNQLLMHPVDLAARGIADGSDVLVSTETGSVRIAVAACKDMMPGVVSLPHGWGQGGQPGICLQHAVTVPGANFNDLVDTCLHDATSGNAILTGIVVSVERIAR